MPQSANRRDWSRVFLGSSLKRRFVFSSRRLSRVLHRSHIAPGTSASICRRHDSLEHNRAEVESVAAADLFALDSSAHGGPSAELSGEQLMFGTGIARVGLDSDAGTDVIELAGEEAVSTSLKPFGCTMTIRRPSPGAS